MDVPSLVANHAVLLDLISFIYQHESMLTDFGAVKIQLTSDCKLAFKKRKPSYEPSSKQKVRKYHPNELIYSIETFPHEHPFPNQNQIPIATEDFFWSTLAHSNGDDARADVTIFPRKSFFYEKVNRKYFSMWQVPGQSLLELLSCKARRVSAPKRALAHGPGAIFPLAATEHGLSSLVYHHTGGSRQWYVIPASERESLEKLIRLHYQLQWNSQSTIVIDPSVLDKYQIRYHRLLQSSNELVVLAAGAFTQSFVIDTCWSESCLFALTNWVRDRHAFLDWTLFPTTATTRSRNSAINLDIFTESAIEKYINRHHLRMKPVENDPLSSNSTMSFPSSGSSFTLAGTDQSAIGDSNNHETHSTPTSMIDSLSELEFMTGEEIKLTVSADSNDDECLHEYYCTFPMMVDQCSKDRDHTDEIVSTDGIVKELQDLWDTLLKDMPNVNLPAKATPQILQNIFDESIPNHETPSPARTIDKSQSESKRHQMESLQRTLYVSGLLTSVTKADLYRAFPGSTKVTFKSCANVKSLNYAFIEHRTVEQARRNSRISLNRVHFGPDCSVEFARGKKSSSSSPTAHRLWNDKTIVITQIPSIVTANNLQEMFVEGHVIKYCPARLSRPITRGKFDSKNTRKILPGYAFVSFDTHEEVAHVMAHTSQYYIHGQPLKISLHRGNQMAET